MRRLSMVLGISLLSLACSSDKKPDPGSASFDGDRTMLTEPGVAGGTIEETAVMTTKVTAVDQKTRKITLQGDDGKPATFTAGPEVRNLDQIKVGDTLKATLKQTLTVYVKKPGLGQAADETYTAAVATAAKGAKPGAVLGESYETVATVTKIDEKARTATLKWADGSTRTAKVREDVDLTRYAVGDQVFIRVTSVLSLLVK